jgi:hypothetical protein
MSLTDEQVRVAALSRVARLFGVEVTQISMAARFDTAFQVSFVSGFRRNEFDKLLDDIRDVADRSVLRQIESGDLEVATVGEYCEHMVRCYRTKPHDVAAVLHAT